MSLCHLGRHVEHERKVDLSKDTKKDIETTPKRGKLKGEQKSVQGTIHPESSKM
jgi:hypothetical protein